jgi:beta-aspartyl-peptidase (threonine type)
LTQKEIEMKAAIIFHGGGINPSTGVFDESAKKCALAGMEILKKGGEALEAVVEAVRTAEDDPLFNSGTGSHLTLQGEAEMDAGVMDGRTLAAGAVGCIKRVKNPILVAKKVMEETDFVLLAGEGATEFARKCGFPDYDPVLDGRRQEWNAWMEKMKRKEKLPWPMDRYQQKVSRWVDTVGAVAIDRQGNLAAATSTGGYPLKMPGRLGDVAIISAATYADNAAGGVSITGNGELVIKTALSKSCCDLMHNGIPAQKALEAMVGYFNKRFNRPSVTIIAIDKNGEMGAARSVERTPHAYLSEVMTEPITNFAPIL